MMEIKDHKKTILKEASVTLKNKYEKDGFIIMPQIMDNIDSETLMDEIISSVENGLERTWEQRLRLQTLMIETPEAIKALKTIRRCVSLVVGENYKKKETKLLREFASLTSYPGCEAQRWHRDQTKPDAVLMTAFMNLYETTLESGALQVIKASHKNIKWLEKINEDNIQTITLPEKSLVIIDCRLIHRGGANKTKKEIRPVLYASYGQGGLEEPGYFMHQSMAGKYNLDEKEEE